MNSGKVALSVTTGLLIGGAVGAVIGILFAPDKGSETRKKISSMSHDYVEDFKEKFDDFLANVTGKIDAEKEMVAEEFKKAKSKVS